MSEFVELRSADGGSTKGWINAQLRAMGAASKASAGAQPPAQSVDAQLYTLLRKLELIAEDTEAEMQATTVSLVRAMPQAVADLDTLQDAAVDLRGAMDGLVEELRTLETQAGASLGLLVEAEHVKQRMLAVSQTLEQAQTLAQTLAAAELAISNGALLSAAEQIGRTKSGLTALERLPRFRDARAKLATLSEHLLQQLRPKLVAALHERDVVGVRECADAASQLGASALVSEVYLQTRQGPLYEQWNAQPRSEGADLGAFGSWLPQFHAALLEVAKFELSFAMSAGLLHPRTLVTQLLAETLMTIGSQCAGRLLEIARAEPEAQEAPLASILALAREAAQWTEALCEQLGCAKNADGDLREAESALRAACDAPFAAVRAQYASVEAAILGRRLAAMRFVTAGSPAAMAAALAEALTDADAAHELAPERCAAFASTASAEPGAAVARLLRLQLATVLEGSLATAHAQASLVLTKLRAALKLAPETFNSNSASGAGAAAPGGDAGAGAGTSGLTVAAAAHAWSHFGVAVAAVAGLQAHATCVQSLGVAVTAVGGGGGEDLDLHTGLPAAVAASLSLLAAARTIALDAALAPAAAQLAAIPSLAVWASPAQPAAFVPAALAYATAVGEHLLMLPQALEPHAHAGRLGAPVFQPDGGLGIISGAAAAADAVFEWLQVIVDRTIFAMLAESGKIRTLSAAGAHQLGADAGYLKMVVSSGLGLEPDPRLLALEAALGADFKSSASQLAAALQPAVAADADPAVERVVPLAVVVALVAARVAGGGLVGGGAGATGAGDGGSAGEAETGAFEI